MRHQGAIDILHTRPPSHQEEGSVDEEFDPIFRRNDFTRMLGSDAWLVCVAWIFPFLLSLNRARLPDQRVALQVPCEQIIVSLDRGFYPMGAWSGMHHEGKPSDGDPDQMFVLR